MPEVEDAVFLGADEARAENDISVIGEDGTDEAGIFRGIIFQIGVLNDDNGRGGVGDAGAESRALAQVDRVMEGADARIGRGQSVEDSARAVAGTIVHTNQFRHAGLGENHGDDLTDRGGFVEHRHDD